MSSEKADWMQWVQWEKPILVRAANADRNMISAHPGIYLFSVGAGPLTPATSVFASGNDTKMEDGDVLYVGITQNKDGIRGRFRGEYLRKDPTKPSSQKVRRATAMIQGWMIDTSMSNRLFVRWAPLDGDRSFLKDIETALIQFYGAPLNVMQQSSFTPFDDV